VAVAVLRASGGAVCVNSEGPPVDGLRSCTGMNSTVLRVVGVDVEVVCNDIFDIIEPSEVEGDDGANDEGLFAKENTAGVDTDDESETVAMLFSVASLCNGLDKGSPRNPPGLLAAGDANGCESKISTCLWIAKRAMAWLLACLGIVIPDFVVFAAGTPTFLDVGVGDAESSARMSASGSGRDTMTFSGLMSVWTSPASSCRYCRPRRSCRAMARTSGTGTPCFLWRSSRLSRFSPRGSHTMQMCTSLLAGFVFELDPAAAAPEMAEGLRGGVEGPGARCWKASRKETTCSRPGWCGFAAITFLSSLISSFAVSA
jgi:hypothetical protein